MNEEFVKNIVINEEFVKDSVMNAKNDPKVVMELSMLKIGGWNKQVTAQQPQFIGVIYGRERTVVVDRNSKKRSILCDRILRFQINT